MTMFGYLFLLFGVVCGVLVWRATHRLLDSIIAAIIVPMIGVIVFGALLGRETFESLYPPVIIFGAMTTIGVLAYMYRKS